MKHRSYRSAIAGLFAGLCATSAAITASSANGTANEATCVSPASDADTSGTAAAALGVHNAERARLSLPPLAWNCRLEHEAGQWAQALSQRGTLQHASADVRKGSGENLWMGTAGHWSVEAMVGRFLEEREQYQHGRFPEVSRTGNWTDVGHYSQIVWRDTREVGCAVVQGAGKEVLVCRYFPAGNIMGRSAY